jgi:hypothetical protein
MVGEHKQVREEKSEGSDVLLVMINDWDEWSWISAFKVLLVVLGDCFAREVFCPSDPEDSFFHGLKLHIGEAISIRLPSVMEQVDVDRSVVERDAVVRAPFPKGCPIEGFSVVAQDERGMGECFCNPFQQGYFLIEGACEILRNSDFRSTGSADGGEDDRYAEEPHGLKVEKEHLLGGNQAKQLQKQGMRGWKPAG